MDRVIQKKKWPPRKIIQLSLALAFVSLVLYGLLFMDKSSKLNVDVERITISTVNFGPFLEYIPIVGNVLPIKTIYLDATEGGRVERIFREAGSLVKYGDPILKLTNTNLLLDIMYREAQLFEQSNNLRNTRLAMEQNRLTLRSNLIDQNYHILRLKRNYERSQELVKQNLISQQEFEEVRDEYEYYLKRKEVTLQSQRQDSIFRQVQISQLEASVQRMQANLEIVKQKLENLVLKAPISGQLTSLNAEIGQSKSAGERLGQIDVLDSFKVRAAIDEHYIARIEVNRTGTFELAGQSYRVRVKKIYPEVREGRFETDLFFEGTPPSDIRRGQTLHIRLELGDLEQAMLLPTGGFYQKTGGQWVYVVDKSDDFATKRKISLGRQNTQFYEVLEGLAEGEKVITSSYDNFGDNDKLILK